MWSRGKARKAETNGYSTANGIVPRPPVVVRSASHAGSWYTDDAGELDRQLSGWLGEASASVRPEPAVRAVIAPHAGLRYSGRCAAFAFGSVDPSSVERIILLGPSHHHFTRRCMLTSATVYRTPLGDISVDLAAVQELRDSGAFEEMTMDVDEAEHSLEMHLPYLFKMMQGHKFKLVPIVVGSLQPSAEVEYGQILAPYMNDPTTFFSVSSDFCHWGTRFGYTLYDKTQGPIHESIEALDREGMEAIETGQSGPFTSYLRKTGNTICGRHPISVLLSTLEQSGLSYDISFVRYEQSSHCLSMRDSSVSYASGVVVVKKHKDGESI